MIPTLDRWADLASPYIAAAGRLCAELGVITLVVLFSMVVSAALFGSARKQINRRRWWQEGPWSL